MPCSKLVPEKFQRYIEMECAVDDFVVDHYITLASRLCYSALAAGAYAGNKGDQGRRGVVATSTISINNSILI